MLSISPPLIPVLHAEAEEREGERAREREKEREREKKKKEGARKTPQTKEHTGHEHYDRKAKGARNRSQTLRSTITGRDFNRTPALRYI